ncbi:MAG: hypothetical protein ACK4E1_03345 [Fervidobacterium nodosum]
MTTITITLIGSLAGLSIEGNVLNNVEIYGKTFFDLFDYLSSNILLPLGGLLITTFVGYFIDKNLIEDELTSKNLLNNNKLIRSYIFILRYITLVLVVFIFLASIEVIK